MRGGNAHADSFVKMAAPINDQNQLQNIKLGGLLSIVLTNQYCAKDVNMDGIVKTNIPSNDQNDLLSIVLEDC